MAPCLKRLFSVVTIMFILCSCANGGYTIKGDVAGLDEGDINLLDIYGHIISTAKVEDGRFVFKGKVDVPCLTYINNALGVTYPVDIPVLLENKTIYVTGDARIGHIDITGTKANDNMVRFKAAKDNLPPGDNDGYLRLVRETFEENSGNILGAMLISNLYSFVSDEELLECCDRLPEELRADPMASHYRKVAQARVETKPGSMFKDFEMRGADSLAVKLGDVVRSNEATVLLFWASWARDAATVIPEITDGCAGYRSKGLGMYNVSLDSDMDMFSKREKDFGLFGPSFANGPDKGDKALSSYGFEGLPRVVLIDKAGKILARGRSFADLEDSLSTLFD